MAEPDVPLQPAAFHILLALAGGERHGYALMSEVEDLSDGAIRIGPGTLYGSIKRLLAAGLIEESQARPDAALDDQRRRYYRLTPQGRAILATETGRLARMVTVAARRNVIPRPALGQITLGEA
jgi:DNA-binding PadR family transcriptional regulator